MVMKLVTIQQLSIGRGDGEVARHWGRRAIMSEQARGGGVVSGVKPRNSAQLYIHILLELEFILNCSSIFYCDTCDPKC